MEVLMYKTIALSKSYGKEEIEFIRTIYPEIVFLSPNTISVPYTRAFRNTTPEFWEEELGYIIKNKPVLHRIFSKVINKLTGN